MPFELPNFTQNPNEFYDVHLPDMGLAECKVVLVIIRKTYGFHIEGCQVRITLSEMCKLTGLGRKAVLDGAAKAESRGLIDKGFSDKGELLWSVRLPNRPNYYGGSVIEPKAVRQSNHPTSSKEKESKKEVGAQDALPLGLDADAQGSKPTPKPKAKRKGNADPRSSHPAIVALHEIMGRYPKKEVYDQLIDVIGNNPNVIDLKKCYEAWTIKGWRPDNYTWVTEWYVSGIPVFGKNGTNGTSEPKSWAAARNLMAKYAQEDQAQAQPQN